ncbi:MAG TPA: hypothetical protein PK536_10425 [Ignavibacteria bacterium]|nr:hypothetical protein [Bacteroidota bacterium]HRI85847.1 hypothetical protein [Ignavibacteria bacterium]HRK00465.1 hypothetical protein [Ignavibacteria bacterium]
MDTYKTNTIIKHNHKIEIENVPFEDGTEVEISVSKNVSEEYIKNLKAKLKGTVLKYDNPFESAISDEDWELLK